MPAPRITGSVRTLVGLTAAALLALAAPACTTPPGPGPPGSSPPDIVVSGGGRTLALRPVTYCWAGMCADGIPPADPPHLTAPDASVSFPVEGWRFTAHLVPDGDPRATGVPATVTPTGPTTHRIEPPPLPGAYRVSLFGSGAGGDVATVFSWTVTPGR